MAKRGFTLVELIVAAGISIILLGVTGEVFIRGWRSYTFSQNASEMQRQLRDTVNYAVATAERAATVASDVTINGTTYVSGANVVVFRALPISINGEIIAGDDYMVIGQRNGAPTITEAVVSAAANSTRSSLPAQRVLTNLNSSLVVHYYRLNGTELTPGTDDLTAARTVKFVEVVSTVSGSVTSSRTLQATVFLRNKTG